MNVRLTLLCVSLVCAGTAAAAEWYRYKDEKGVTVIANSIPPSLVGRGYEVVDDEGRRLRVVERELTPAELEARRQAELARKETEEVERTRKRRDEELLKLYASVSDVEGARDRKLAAIDTDISRIKARKEQATLQKSKFEVQAAARERAGEAPSAELVDNIARLSQRIEVHAREIEAREREKEAERRNFGYDVQRMKCLLGQAGPEACGAPQTAGTNTPAAKSGH
jgi:hypothetical protein